MAIPDIPDWRERILLGVGVRPTPENLRFMSAWAQAEGGTYANNPFNTTWKNQYQIGDPNSAGVRGYSSPQAGIDATINTLTNGRYGNIIGALRAGDNAMSAAQALANSPWGTGALTMKVLGGNTAGLTTVVGNQPLYTTAAGMTQQPTGPLGSTATTPRPSSVPLPTVTPPQAPRVSPEGPQLGGMPMTDMSVISPLSVAMRANLSDAVDRVSQARQDVNSAVYGYDMSNTPVARTLTTLQTGSTESDYRTIDLAQDFDGPVHPNANPVVNMARQFLGTPYLYGGADPRKGFDCSGFVQYLYSQAGVSINRTVREQFKQGEAVSKVGDLLPGDVVFFDSGNNLHHEGLYIGGGQFIHAPHTGDVVKISSLSEKYYASQFVGGRRFMATQASVTGETAAPSDANSRQIPGGLAEAFYDPLGSYDSGHFGGPIGGHSDHVHISQTDPQGMLNAIKLAQKLGLHVGENPYVDTVEPVHVEGSYHYRTFDGTFDGKKLGQGIDVSGPADKMAQFYRLMTGS